MKRSVFRSIIPVIIILFLLVASVWMIFNNGEVQRNSLISTIRRTTESFHNKLNNFSKYLSLQEENERLVEENSRLAELLVQYAAISDMLELASDTARISGKYSFIPATVIHYTTDDLSNFLIINKGYDDGVREDMGVMTMDGLVGYVVSTSPHYARVASFLTLGAKYSAVLRKTGTFGTFSWSGRACNKAILSDIPVHTQVEVGDTVVSSGFSSLFPPGIPLGIVDSKEMTDGINYSLSVLLFVNFKALNHVYVAKASDMEEVDSLIINEQPEI